MRYDVKTPSKVPRSLALRCISSYRICLVQAHGNHPPFRLLNKTSPRRDRLQSKLSRPRLRRILLACEFRLDPPSLRVAPDPAFPSLPFGVAPIIPVSDLRVKGGCLCQPRSSNTAILSFALTCCQPRLPTFFPGTSNVWERGCL